MIKEILEIIDKVEHRKGKYLPPENRQRIMAKEIDKLYQEKIEALEELVEWLDSECPKGTETADLSHNFAEHLRERLDNLSLPSLTKERIIEALKLIP